MEKNVASLAKNVKLNSINLANSSEKSRNKALLEVKKALWENREKIFAENSKDIDAAKKK